MEGIPDFLGLAEAISTFKTAARILKKFRKCLPCDVDLRMLLKGQRAAFEAEALILLSYVSGSQDVANDMLREATHALWQDRNFRLDLQEFLGASMEICIDIVTEIQSKLQDIENVTSHFKKVTGEEKVMCSLQ